MNLKLLTAAPLLVSSFTPALAQDSPPEKIGGFTLRTVTDPMSDASRGILVSPSGDVEMVVKCDTNGPGTLYISFISRRYLGAVRYKTRDVKFRIDGAPAETISAYYDGSTANILDLKPRSAGGAFVGRLLNASKLTVQVTNYDYQPYTAVIDMDGFRTGLARAAAICRDSNWYSVASAPASTSRSETPGPAQSGSSVQVTNPAVAQQLGPNIWLYPAETPSGKCIRAPSGYRGTGSASRPAISSYLPRC